MAKKLVDEEVEVVSEEDENNTVEEITAEEENEEIDNKKNTSKENKKDKVYFIQRLAAFLIDIVIVYVVASLIASPFIDYDKNLDYSNRITELQNSYINEEIDVNTFLVQYIDVSYKSAKNIGAYSIITIFLEILYFVVFQIYSNGQTFGKKLCKIKIKSEDGDLNMNQMIFRTFIADFILVDIIEFIFMLIGNKEVYFYGTMLFQCIQYLIVLISIVMISKNGYALHDKIAHTKVIKVN